MADAIVRNETVAIGAATVRVSPTRKRVAWMVQNNSPAAQTVSVSMQKTGATPTAGILLNVGDSISDSDSGGYQCWQGDIVVVGTAGGATAFIMER